MTLLSLFHAFEATSLGAFGRKSSVFFPAVEVLHLLGLTSLLGSVLVVNLKIFGMILPRQSVESVASAMKTVLWPGLVLTVGSGLLLFLTEAVKCYYNLAFWYKMALLVCAVLAQLKLYSRLQSAPTRQSQFRVAATISLLLWFGVGVAGRAIAFV
jgi:hypothetical protein